VFSKRRNIHNSVQTYPFRVRFESMMIQKWRGINGNVPIVHCVLCVTSVLKTSSESYYRLSFASMEYR
jgi:NhaP-type Na+/H+ and K+/H+ antiporter